MKLIVGLGNIGERYRGTRHNVGFELVDILAGGKRFGEDKKMEVEILKEGKFVFVKPTTYMNDSGRAVRKVCDFYKIGVEDLIVCHDDLDLKLGEYKVQKGVGPKVHNGIASVEECVGSKEFVRVRIGVDGREGDRSMSGADYVLARFTSEEREMIEEVLEEVSEELLVTLGL